MDTYAIKIKLDDDTLQDTKFLAMELDSAEELMEGIYNGTNPRDNWAGLAVIRESDGDIYSEMEW